MADVSKADKSKKSTPSHDPCNGGFDAMSLLERSLELGSIPPSGFLSHRIVNALDIWSLFEIAVGDSHARGQPKQIPDSWSIELLVFMLERTTTPRKVIDNVVLLLESRESSFTLHEWKLVVQKLDGFGYFAPGCLFDKRLEKLLPFLDELFFIAALDRCKSYINHVHFACWASSRLGVSLTGYDPEFVPVWNRKQDLLGILCPFT